MKAVDGDDVTEIGKQ